MRLKLALIWAYGRLLGLYGRAPKPPPASAGQTLNVGGAEFYPIVGGPMIAPPGIPTFVGPLAQEDIATIKATFEDELAAMPHVSASPAPTPSETSTEAMKGAYNDMLQAWYDTPFAPVSGNVKYPIAHVTSPKVRRPAGPRRAPSTPRTRRLEF